MHIVSLYWYEDGEENLMQTEQSDGAYIDTLRILSGLT